MCVIAPHRWVAALSTNWPPFVLVAGLCVLGFVSHLDGLFSWLAARGARVGRRPLTRLAALLALVAVVTIVLNLDTAAVFVTPVVVMAAHRGRIRVDGALYGSIVMANASSLLLVGSNLTNLLVLRHSSVSAAEYARGAAVPEAVALIVSALVVVVLCRPHAATGGTEAEPEPEPEPVTIARPGWTSVTSLGVAVVLMVVLPDPAVPVLLDAIVALTIMASTRHDATLWRRAWASAAPVTLLTLLALSVVAGVIGSVWLASAPTTRGSWTPALLGAGASIVMNNLPAASLLASHAVPSPVPLLIGLDVGPNLMVTGSLAWLLWWRAAALAGERPSIRRAVTVGATSAIVALPAAVFAYAVVH